MSDHDCLIMMMMMIVTDGECLNDQRIEGMRDDRKKRSEEVLMFLD